MEKARNGLLTLNSTTHPWLEAGQQYWICDEPTATDSYNAWYENNQGLTNTTAYEDSEWAWLGRGPPNTPNGVFRVIVTPVPEPSVAMLAAFGGGLLLTRFRRLFTRC